MKNQKINLFINEEYYTQRGRIKLAYMEGILSKKEAEKKFKELEKKEKKRYKNNPHLKELD